MIARLFYALLKKSVPYSFDDKCLHAFNTLKSTLIPKPILCH